jgi:hypothetical protein
LAGTAAIYPTSVLKDKDLRREIKLLNYRPILLNINSCLSCLIKLLRK